MVRLRMRMPRKGRDEMLGLDASLQRSSFGRTVRWSVRMKRAEQSTMLCGKREGGERQKMWTMMVMVLRKMLSNGSAERDLAELCVCLSWAIRVSEALLSLFSERAVSAALANLCIL